jgi:DNA-binding NarL/FixJ family response regulator
MLRPLGKSNGIRVVAADDNRQVRDKIVQLLKADFDVIGTAADGKAALELVMVLEPEVVVLDISMPVMSGIEAAAEITKRAYKTKIVFLTVHDDSDFVKAALGVGASGYVVKSQMATDLRAAIIAASEGKKFISSSCAVVED